MKAESNICCNKDSHHDVIRPFAHVQQKTKEVKSHLCGKRSIRARAYLVTFVRRKGVEDISLGSSPKLT